MDSGEFLFFFYFLLNHSYLFEIFVVNFQLRSCSWGGHHEVVKLLIRHPEIQIDLADKEQRTALRAAVSINFLMKSICVRE